MTSGAFNHEKTDFKKEFEVLASKQQSKRDEHEQEFLAQL
jgi:hypothetical protein